MPRLRTLNHSVNSETARAITETSGEITYEYELRDIAPWAKAESLQAVFPEIKAVLEKPNRTDTEGAVLTSDGWVDEHMVR